MKPGRDLGIGVLLLALALQTAQGCAQCSSKLERLERLLIDQQAQLTEQQAQMMDYQAQLVEQQAKMTEQQAQMTKQQAQIEWLKRDNQNLKAADFHKQEPRSSDHPGGEQRTETSVHTQRAPRSDDGGPLEVVVNRLAQDVTQLSGNLQALSGNVQALKNLDATRGSAFVRWGSSTCSPSSQLVYAGVLGGSHYTQKSGAANTLCLSMSPRLLNVPAGVQYFAYLYGGEYQTDDFHMDEDPVCAVCWSPLSSSMMVPGTNECPGGWTTQFSGYLMASKPDLTAASEFVCVDTKRESLPSSKDNHNGHLLYYTKTACGSLPCSPYVNNKIVTCVVCSK